MVRAISFGLILLLAVPALADDWTGKQIVPKKDSEEIKFGDWINDKKVYWTSDSLYDCAVIREEAGFLRVFDGQHEGWVDKDDFVLLDNALAYWNDRIKVKPNDDFALLSRSMCLIMNNEYDKAIVNLTTYITNHKKDPVGYNYRGIAWTMKRDTKKALADFDESIKLSPRYDKAISCRAMMWYTIKEYDKAIADYDKAIEINPNHAETYSNRGGILFLNNEYDRAVDDFTKAIGINPKFGYAYAVRGQIRNIKKEYDKAVADLNEAIKIDPKYVDSVRILTWIHASCPDEKYRDGKKAVEYGLRLIEIDTAPDSLASLAAAYAESGDFDKAVLIEEKAIIWFATNTKITEADKPVASHDNPVKEFGIYEYFNTLALSDHKELLILYKSKKTYREWWKPATSKF